MLTFNFCYLINDLPNSNHITAHHSILEFEKFDDRFPKLCTAHGKYDIRTTIKVFNNVETKSVASNY